MYVEPVQGLSYRATGDEAVQKENGVIHKPDDVQLEEGRRSSSVDMGIGLAGDDNSDGKFLPRKGSSLEVIVLQEDAILEENKSCGFERVLQQKTKVEEDSGFENEQVEQESGNVVHSSGSSKDKGSRKLATIESTHLEQNTLWSNDVDKKRMTPGKATTEEKMCSWKEICQVNESLQNGPIAKSSKMLVKLKQMQGTNGSDIHQESCKVQLDDVLGSEDKEATTTRIGTKPMKEKTDSKEISPEQKIAQNSVEKEVETKIPASGCCILKALPDGCHREGRNNNGSSSSVALDVESAALVADKKVIIVGGGATDKKKNRGSALRQVIAAFVANIGTINTGLVFGFSAVAIPQLQDANSTISVDASQSSWIASLASVTTPIGCLLSGYLMDLLGRRLTLLLTEAPLVAGWLLISAASSVNMIYAGRLLVGLGSGMVGAPARVYTGEVTQPHLRGMLSALASVGVSLGVLLEYALGAAVTWPVLAGLSAAIPLTATLLLATVPETPNWLLARGRVDGAKQALIRLRGNTYNVEQELGAMMQFAAKTDVTTPRGPRDTLRAIMRPGTLKPLILLMAYFLIYQFSGVNSVTFYAVEVFQDSGATMNKYLATVILGVVRLISTIAACVALRRCGRRPLTLISSIGCGLSMVALGTYMHLSKLPGGLDPWLSWIPVACIMIFTIASTLGYLVVPWVMIGEVFPASVRGVAGGMTTCAAHLSIFAVVKTYPSFQRSLTAPGTFWLYGAISLLGTGFFYRCLPETKGKTLQEIEEYFSGPSRSLPPVLSPAKGEALP